MHNPNSGWEVEDKIDELQVRTFDWLLGKTIDIINSNRAGMLVFKFTDGSFCILDVTDSDDNLAIRETLPQIYELDILVNLDIITDDEAKRYSNALERQQKAVDRYRQRENKNLELQERQELVRLKAKYDHS